MVYSTRLGGGESDFAYGVCRGPSNTIYVTGQAGGIGYKGTHAFPVLSAIQTNIGDATNPQTFVARLDSAGQLMMSTYHGGNLRDRGMGIAVGPDGTPSVIGHTDSLTGFPLVNAFQTTNSGGMGRDDGISITPGCPVALYPHY